MTNRKQLSVEEIDSILGNYKKSLEGYIHLYIHRKVELIPKHIYIVYEGDAVYKKLKKHCARGVCIPSNGYIYIRHGTELTDHLLVHELVHRFSRNRRLIISVFPWRWVEGVDFPNDIFTDINEAITEMITVDIIGEKEMDNPYNRGLDIINALCSKTGKRNMIQAYFNSDRKFFRKVLKKHYYEFKKNFLLLMHWQQYDISTEYEKRLTDIIKWIS